MSGHNNWSTIKNKKAKTDAAKGKIFTKIGREIVIAVKAGGSADPAQNSKLKDVIAKAKAANMPNDNIQRSIKKAAGEGESANYKEVTYEGYAPCGVAVIYTDPADFSAVRDKLEAAGCTFLSAERAMIPTTTTALPDEESVEKVTRLLDWLEDYEDTESVYHDAELPEEEDEDE